MRASLTGDEATFATDEDSVPLSEAAAGELHEAMDAMRAASAARVEEEVAARRRQLEQQAQKRIQEREAEIEEAVRLGNQQEIDRLKAEVEEQAYNYGTVVAANLRQNDELQHLFLCGKGTMCRDGINVDELLAIKKVKERQLEEAVAMATQGAMDEEETTWRKHAVEKAEAEV
mmetsp:Transcript_22232/g.48357  ORF Transcript_22232/g.48357 Transcript_22232/m.48357 type:complete len:174 (+) Transcript_22232:1712-2233(+)